jgi:peptidoglycan/LPS O-acetylase OafA/YrhL
MKEIRALTGIRGIAALTVFLSHTQGALKSRGVDVDVPTWAERLFLSGGRQVDIFFVLSGFLLALIYSNWFDAGVSSGSYYKFLRKRLARIYPLQAFMLCLILGFVLLAYLRHAQLANGLDRFSFSSLPYNFLLIHAWGFDGIEGGTWNPPSWSISIEFLAYLVFPLFLAVTVNARKNHKWWLLLAIVVAGSFCNAVLFWGQAGILGIPRGLIEFGLGCVCASFISSSVADWLRTTAGSLWALAVLIMCYLLTPDTSFAIAVCAAPLILALTGKNPVSAFYGWTPVYFLGEISYSIYLGHFLYTSISYRLINVEWMRSSPLAVALALLFIIGLVIGLSTLTYFAVERPARDWLSGNSRSKKMASDLATKPG